MLAPKPGSSASAFLDGARGIAALLVAFGHAKLLLLRDAGSVGGLTLLQKAFYFSTNLGSSAVMVFFVLSGYLVGGSVVRSLAKDGQFGWGNYAITRVSRLYTVLVPALIIGGLTDLLGSSLLSGSAPYASPHFGHSLPENIAGHLTPTIALGNLFFLQEVLVPTFGSNHPLWSLTNEGWYYVLFPLIAVSAFGSSRLSLRIFLAVMALAILTFLPLKISLLGLVWVMGAIVAALPRRRVSLLLAVVSSAAFFAFLLGLSAGLFRIAGANFVTGGIFAAMLYCWLCWLEDVPAGSIVRLLTGSLSNISYTLYLMHVPFMVLAAAVIIGRGDRFSPTVGGCAMVVGLLLLSVLHATMLWFLFERNTSIVRSFLSRAFGLVSASARKPQSV